LSGQYAQVGIWRDRDERVIARLQELAEPYEGMVVRIHPDLSSGFHDANFNTDSRRGNGDERVARPEKSESHASSLR
jgi:hypothetical protein